jgi:hypothetical protein
MARPALLRRFPKLLSKKLQSTPIIEPDDVTKYPELADDITVADKHIGKEFEESDLEALRKQNQYRRQQVVIILGAALLSGLGGLQAALPDERWPGILLSALGFVLTSVGIAQRELGAYGEFLDERVKAERLRSAYFRFLSRTGRYEQDNREAQLRRAVLSIKRGEEPR